MFQPVPVSLFLYILIIDFLWNKKKGKDVYFKQSFLY